jgi:hypothetical protein
MTRWRAKRRYEANRRFGERADEALVAIAILKGRRDGIELDQTDTDLAAKLRRGRELLEDIRDALSSESAVDPYEMAIAEELKDEDPNPPSVLVADFDELIESLETAERTLDYTEGLDDVRTWLKRISNIADRTSRESISRMRGSLATGTR